MSVRITVIGTGYVGLVTGACLAELGHDVICVDKEQAKIEGLTAGVMPIYEPGLDDLVLRNTKAGRLRFSLDVAASVKGRDAVFIAVGTPTDGPSGRADLRFVQAAAAEVASHVDGFTVIVTKSTVPVGTNRIVAAIAKKHADPAYTPAVASNPEFLREGAAISDFMEPDRIVIGAEDPRAIAVMKRIYDPFVGAGQKLMVTGIETAELIKYAANAFLAVKISFINEMADLCEELGADVEQVAAGIGSDARIGPAFLRVGPGWGGSCFPKDTKALQATAHDLGVPVRIVEAAVTANAERKKAMAERIAAACDGAVKGKRIAVLGLTFKGQTDDMRDSPSLDIVPALIARGAEVVAYDPSSPKEAARLLPEVTLAESAADAARGADALVVLAEWKVFRSLDLGRLARLMRHRALVDLRNLFTAAEAKAAGFDRYTSIGRADRIVAPEDAAARL